MRFYILKITKSNRKANKIFLFLSLFLITILSLGYSLLNQNLSISGDASYFLSSNKLYNVLKRESKSNGLAREYTGSHQDSFGGTGNQSIYYYYASNDSEGTAIQNKNNVIFAGHCWQMIRTTDTGGVKMIYNGETENNQCLNTRGNHVGYSSYSSENFASNYYYGTNYAYDKNSGVFRLAGELSQTTWNATTGPSLVGKYTCKSASNTEGCATLYLVNSYVNATDGYAFSLDSNSLYSQFGLVPFNSTANSPAYVGYMYNTVYSYLHKNFDTNTYKFANSFTYSNGTYTLSSNSVSFAGGDDSDISSLSTHHYTCWNTTGTCSTISYIYGTGTTGFYYVNITDGKNVNNILTEMLSVNIVNQKSSTIKSGLEAWYAKNLDLYSSYIEDTVFCGNRTIDVLGGWNPNGGQVPNNLNYLKFTEYDSTLDLSCPNVTDQFSTNNSSAQLNYKVGLMDSVEMNLLNNNNARITNYDYWTISPRNFGIQTAGIKLVESDGVLDGTSVNYNKGLRPAISLIPGIEYLSGDGTMANPYIVDAHISNMAWDYPYKGSEDIFVAPTDGLYKLEVWGGEGGKGLANGALGGQGGYGGYSIGYTFLHSGEVIYINVGGRGADGVKSVDPSPGGYNGGGNGRWDNHDDESSGGGGGATHMAKVSGTLNTLSSNVSDILIVAGGGGGVSWNYNAGHGGGYKGNSVTELDTTIDGGTQTTGNAFGKGGNAATHSNTPGGGGGGGYYGGYAGVNVDAKGVPGGGGSGYIGNSLLVGKHMVCYNCATSTDVSTYTISNTSVSSSPVADSSKTGTGYAKISLVSTHTINITSTNLAKGTTIPTSSLIGDGGTMSFTISPVLGYIYESNTCGATVIGNTLTLSNVTSDINCTISFTEKTNFDYKGSEDRFIAPEGGLYRLEVWGAEGGKGLANGSLGGQGGYGGYARGNVILQANDILYINVGGRGANGVKSVDPSSGGYNGGGNGRWDNHDDEASGGGGGATSIAKISGKLNTLSNNISDILIVAGGGGGVSWDYTGGHGGGYQGNNVTELSTTIYGGTQTGGSAFGQGGNAATNSNTPGGGGGGGFYGGNAGVNVDSKGVPGGGGSGYIANSLLLDKHMTCYNCRTSSDVSTKTNSNTSVSGTATSDYSKSGNGYAKVTKLVAHTVNVSSTDISKGNVSMISNLIEDGTDAKVTLSIVSGYIYDSNTCGGTVSGNIMTISNVTTDITCTVSFVNKTNYDYVGGEEIFIAPQNGVYKLEVWGAEGGRGLANGVASAYGGYGGYAVGNVTLSLGEILYVNVGGKGATGVVNVNDTPGGYNGGGISHWDKNDDEASGGGGGATHIAKVSGVLSTLSSNTQNILIVAGGGAGGAYGNKGGDGGGASGTYNVDVWDSATFPGTQTSGYAFGQGGPGAANTATPGGGGGGGFYGGYGGMDSGRSAVPGAGGSGYIGTDLLSSKHMTCYNCAASSDDNTRTITTTNVSESPVADYVKTGNGYAKITLVQ